MVIMCGDETATSCGRAFLISFGCQKEHFFPFASFSAIMIDKIHGKRVPSTNFCTDFLLCVSDYDHCRCFHAYLRCRRYLWRKEVQLAGFSIWKSGKSPEHLMCQGFSLFFSSKLSLPFHSLLSSIGIRLPQHGTFSYSCIIKMADALFLEIPKK